MLNNNFKKESKTKKKSTPIIFQTCDLSHQTRHIIHKKTWNLILRKQNVEGQKKHYTKK